MNNFCIMRIGRLKSNTAVALAARHNLREYDPHNVDQDRTADNQKLGSQSREELMARLNERLASVDRKIRPDAVRAVEYIITRSPESSHVDDTKYFNDAIAWMKEKHGNKNVLSVTKHMDEDTPHLHSIVVPIVQKEKNGMMINSLSAKHFFSGKKVLSNLQTEFYEKVGAYHGLDRGIMKSGAKHIPLKAFYNSETMEGHTGDMKLPRSPQKRKEFVKSFEGYVRRSYAKGEAKNKTKAEQYRAAADKMKNQRNTVIEHAKKLEKKIDKLEHPEKYKEREKKKNIDRNNEMGW